MSWLLSNRALCDLQDEVGVTIDRCFSGDVIGAHRGDPIVFGVSDTWHGVTVLWTSSGSVWEIDIDYDAPCCD